MIPPVLSFFSTVKKFLKGTYEQVCSLTLNFRFRDSAENGYRLWSFSRCTFRNGSCLVLTPGKALPTPYNWCHDEQTTLDGILDVRKCNEPYNIWARGLFLKSPDSFSGPESYFVFAVFTFKFKVSIILTMIRWKYQLTKQNWQVCGLGTVSLFNRFGF